MSHMLLNRIVAFVLGCGLAVMVAGAAAAQGQPLYPWCAFFNAGGGYSQCLFYDFEQCRESVIGVGGHCYKNLEYVEPPPSVRKPRVKHKLPH
jgi:hypothetical protein